MAAKPPTGRIATGPASNGAGPGGRKIAPWRSFRDEDENNPDLVWPISLDTYASMDQDGQVAALVRLIDWAVRNYRFELHPGDLPPALAEKLAADTHHHIAGADVDDEHAAEIASVHRLRVLRQILRALSSMHTVFELVGDVDQDGTWRLQDLAYVDPKQLSRWHFGVDERVEQIDMWSTWPPIELPASRLAIFRYDPTARHPYGQSLLRPLYEPWVAKDRLVRIDMLANERHGMGIPTVEMSDEAQAAHQDDYLHIVTGVAAGEETGVVMPAGASFEIKGLTGSLPRTLESIRYHDEAMSRTMQGQVSQLGQTSNGSGSYALSMTLVDLLDEARDMVARWIAEAYTEQIVARWCEFNDVQVPRMPMVRATRPEPAPVPLEPADYVSLADAGLINPAQPDVRIAVAKRFGLPLPDQTPLPAPSTERAQLAAAGRRLAAAPEAPANPGVGHRLATPVERRARVLFAQVDAEWADAVDETSAVYQAIRAALIAAAADEVASSDLLERLDELGPTLRDTLIASIPADLVGAATGILTAAAAAGAAQVADEFARQGADDVDAPDPEYADRAAAEVALVADTLAVTTADQAASLVARHNGPDDTAAQVAEEVREQLEQLTTAHTDDLARGGVSRAQHEGRVSTMRANETDIVGIYASELLDSSTCTPCSRIDGTEYADLDAAMADYPTGGFRRCDGGDRCRGTLVAIHASEQEVSVR